MNTEQRINLPPPSPATRQVGVGVRGSPLALSRNTSFTSTQSDPRSPEESLRETLLAYKTFLQHEMQFLESEIAALIERPIGENPREETAMLALRDGLKVRYNTQSIKMARIKALLDVM